MPYSSIEQIPEYVQEALDERDQRAWMAAFNSAHDEYGDEEIAFQVAADAVDLSEKTENGAAVEMGFVSHAEQVKSAPDKYNRIDFVPPKAAQNAAQKVLDWKDEHGDEVTGMTRTGWRRANQLASGEPLSPDVVKRMAAFKRHQDNAKIADKYKGTPWRDNGYVAWLGWGDDAGILEFAPDRVEQMDNADETENGANAQVAAVVDIDQRRINLATDLEHASNPHGEWLALYPMGPVEHPGHPDGEYEVTPEFQQEMLEAFEHFAAHEQYPPIQGAHAKDSDDKAQPGPHAKAWGLVTDMRIEDGTLEGYHVYTPRTAQLVEEGALPYRSPTHAMQMNCTRCKDGDDFKTFKNVLREVSFVRQGQLVDLGIGSAADYYLAHDAQLPDFQPRDTIMTVENEEQTQAPPAEESEESTQVEHMDDDTAEALAKVMDKLAALESRLDDMENMYDGEDDMEQGDDMEQADQSGDTEHNADDKRIVELEHQLLKLQRENDRAKLSGELPHEDAAVIDELVEMPEKTRGVMVKRLKANASDTDDTDTVVSHGSKSTNSAPASNVQELSHYREQAEESGVKSYGLEFARWLRSEDAKAAKAHGLD